MNESTFEMLNDDLNYIMKNYIKSRYGMKLDEFFNQEDIRDKNITHIHALVEDLEFAMQTLESKAVDENDYRF
jgi:hypothetical protein